MRFLTIPDATSLLTNDGPQAYPFSNFVVEFVFSDRRWRKDWADDYGSLTLKLVQGLPGTRTELTDQEHERVSQCAVSAEVQPMLVPSVMPHIHAITLAAKER